jgi:hypothetical protein
MNIQLILILFGKLGQVNKSIRLIQALLCKSILVTLEHSHALTQKLSTVIDIRSNRGQVCLGLSPIDVERVCDSFGATA